MFNLNEILIQPFSDYGFMSRALWSCIALSLGAAPVGVFLLLRRMSLTGDAIAHGILPGVAISYIISGLSLASMTIGGFIAGCCVALLSSFISRNTLLKEDASLAAFYLISLALGVLIITSQGSMVDLMHVLFGNILAISQQSLVLLVVIALGTLLLMTLIYRPLVIDSVDSQFLQSISRLSPWVSPLFMLLVVINLVGGFQALGTLLTIGLMILPASCARLWTQGIFTLLILAPSFALVCCLLGLTLSYHLNLLPGPSIILVLGVAYMISLCIGKQGLMQRYLNQTRHKLG